MKSTSQDSITSSGNSPSSKRIKAGGLNNDRRVNAPTAFGGRNSPSGPAVAAVQRSVSVENNSITSSSSSSVSATIRRSSGAAVRSSSSSIGGDLSPISPAGADDPTMSNTAAAIIEWEEENNEDEDDRDNDDEDDVAIFSPLLPVKHSISPTTTTIQKNWQTGDVEMGDVITE